MLRNFRTKALKALLIQLVFLFWFVFSFCIATKRKNEQIKKDKCFLTFIFFLCCGTKKENEPKERNTLIKRNSKYFNGNFSATGCCKNCLKTQLFLIKVTTGACRPRTPCCFKTCHSEALNMHCYNDSAVFRILPIKRVS